jgi:cobyrinic acid a,c-diamide synthase
MRAFVIAGTHSGSGKTTISLGIMAALVRKGLSVQPFKVGPDFIDSGLHRLATGKISRNLDLWMCGQEYCQSCFHRASADADVAVIEGVMGLYDGNLNTASLARLLDLPVILVVDGYGMAESAGPIVRGFRDWESDGGRKSIVQGIIFNRVASEHHYKRLSTGVRDVPVLGYLPRDLDFEIPHRHLGLMTAEEEPVSSEGFSRLADTVAKHIDLDRILEIAKEKTPSKKVPIGLISPIGPIGPMNKAALREPVRIAVALDKAFCFYYRDNLDLLEEAGAELVFFSPLADCSLPADVDAVYLGGGYPELHVAELSANASMRASIKGFAESGGCLYAECGGLMYLSGYIADFDNRSSAMSGVLPLDTVMTRGRARLGYREAVLKRDCLLGRPGETMRGHEFHYSTIRQGKDVPVEEVYEIKDGSGKTIGTEGIHYKNTVASYVHIHFGSNLSIAASIIESSRKRRSS